MSQNSRLIKLKYLRSCRPIESECAGIQPGSEHNDLLDSLSHSNPLQEVIEIARPQHNWEDTISCALCQPCRPLFSCQGSRPGIRKQVIDPLAL
jgi:hypothetical protein